MRFINSVFHLSVYGQTPVTAYIGYVEGPWSFLYKSYIHHFFTQLCSGVCNAKIILDLLSKRNLQPEKLN